MNRTQKRQNQREAENRLKLRGTVRGTSVVGQVVAVPYVPVYRTVVERRERYAGGERYYTRKSDGKRVSRGPFATSVRKTKAVVGYVTGPIKNAA